MTAGFSAAFAAHGASRLEEAELGYRAVLAADPKHADAWHLLGVIAQQRGQAAQAVDYIERALELSGPQEAYLSNLGVAYETLGRSAEAAVALEQAVALEPSSFTAQFALANALTSLRRLEEAVERYGRALVLQPDSASAHNNLGNALQALNRHNEAAACYRQTIALQPTHGRAHYNLGVILKNAQKLPEAAESFRRALVLVPDLAEAHVNLGVTLHDLGQLEEAINHARTAIELNPKDAAAFNNLGTVLRDTGRFDEAMECYATALTLRPAFAEASHNAGIALQTEGRNDEALERYRRAQDLNPAFVDAELNAALLVLMSGNFNRGWGAYECRWRRFHSGTGFRDFPYPRWEGENGGGGTVLIWGEQGVGDKVLYAGMIPDLLARGLGVVMETDARLVALFERSFPGVKAVAKQNPPDATTQRPDIRWHSPLASLGRWLRPDAASFPQRESYLVPDEARRARYRAHLETAGPGPIVGISWISRNPKIGQHKTLDLRQWAPILQTPGVRFVDLQYGDTAAERAAVEAELGVHIGHIADLDLREDIDGVAALAAACDLVISVSNTTVHLAAAVGRPTWVIVPASVGNLWYWMHGSNHTPWYKTVTIIRQTRLGIWEDIISQIEKKLSAYVKTRLPLQQIN